MLDDYYRTSLGSCPACGSTWIKKIREPYCGPGDVNYLSCKCNKCGKQWEERD